MNEYNYYIERRSIIMEEKTIRDYGMELLQPYIEKINHSEIRSFLTEALFYVPDSFFLLPASSSGKYHPSYSLGAGGLVRHTAAALYFAETLFVLPEYKFTPKKRDYIRVALILHDTQKPSKTHPIEVKLLLEPLRDKYPYVFEHVISLIESHMGQWDYFGKFPQPETSTGRFVHLCDFLASRKEVTVELFRQD